MDEAVPNGTTPAPKVRVKQPPPAWERDFRRPKDLTIPRRHLYVANCGKDESAIRAAFSLSESDQGGVEEVLIHPTKAFAYISFKQVAQAIAAKDWLNRKESPHIPGKLLHIEFAARRRLVADGDEIECTSLTKDVQVPGLYLIENFVSSEEEAALLAMIDNDGMNQKEASKEKEREKFVWLNTLSRRVQHYGYEFSYETRNVDTSKPLEGGLPSVFTALMERLEERFRDTHCEFTREAKEWDQLTINEYLPGQGISPHIDTHSAFEDGICSLSLLSDTVMLFDVDNSDNEEMKEKESGHETPKDRRKYLVLPRRSLLVMSGESRYSWRHAIFHRKTDRIDGRLVKRDRRISLTFRRVRRDPCQCAYPQYCDSRQQAQLAATDAGEGEGGKYLRHITTNTQLSSLAPTAEEIEHVHKVYDNIAAHFSHTRKAKWPKVVEFLSNRPPGTLVADIGCGNGKYLDSNGDCCFIGCDRSTNLIDICRERQFEVFVCDALKVPFRDNSFDLSISIAVLHHLSTLEHRLHAISELLRVTKPGGEILVCAWAVEQDENSKRQFEEQDVYVPWNLQPRFKLAETQVADKEASHSVIDEKKNVIVFQRYCHLYKEGELEALVAEFGQEKAEILESFYDNSNWFIKIRKKKGHVEKKRVE